MGRGQHALLVAGQFHIRKRLQPVQRGTVIDRFVEQGNLNNRSADRLKSLSGSLFFMHTSVFYGLWPLGRHRQAVVRLLPSKNWALIVEF
jgi:hypothetical protein